MTTLTNEEIIEIEIPELTAEFLEPIPGDSPVGADAGNDPDYFKLSMEIPKVTPDYKNWIELSNLILKEKSKDLKVAAWLVFAFYRTENVKGLKDGLSILSNLLRKYGNDLHPANPIHKTKAIQFIASSRVTKLLEKEKIDKQNINDIKEAGKLLDNIIIECGKLLPDNPPVLKPLSDVINTLLESSAFLLKPVEKIGKKEEIEEKPIVTTIQQPAKQTTPVEPNSIQQSLASESELITQLRKTISSFF